MQSKLLAGSIGIRAPLALHNTIFRLHILLGVSRNLVIGFDFVPLIRWHLRSTINFDKRFVKEKMDVIRYWRNPLRNFFLLFCPSYRGDTSYCIFFFIVKFFPSSPVIFFLQRVFHVNPCILFFHSFVAYLLCDCYFSFVFVRLPVTYMYGLGVPLHYPILVKIAQLGWIKITQIILHSPTPTISTPYSLFLSLLLGFSFFFLLFVIVCS